MSALTKKDIEKLFRLLNDEMKRQQFKGEIYLVGGAVMCLVFNSRKSTYDVDGLFLPASEMRKAASRVAAEAGVRADWLNDGVKGYLSHNGKFEAYLELSHLKVFSASADYLLAMKCLAMRIGEEFHDVEDVRYLIRTLGITSYEQAVKIIGAYYPIEKFPQKTLYVLEELLSASSEILN